MTYFFNPYTTLRPAQGSAFVGRTEELEKITSGNHNSVIFGYSRFGKTSLLTNAVKQFADAPVIYIPECGQNEADLLRKLKFQSRKIPILADAISNATVLEEAIETIQEKSVAAGVKTHILLDETLQLFSDAQTVRNFRAFNQQYNSISFTYAVFPFAFEHMQAVASRFQDSVQILDMKPLAYDQVKSLATLSTDKERILSVATERDRSRVIPFVFESDVIDSIYRETGGFPVLVQGLMQKLVDVSLSTDTPALLSDKNYCIAIDQFTKEIEAQLAHLWNAFTPAQKRIIRFVHSGHKNTSSQIESALSLENPSVFIGAWKPLSEDGLRIITPNDSSEYFFNGTILKNVLGKFAEHYTIEQ